MYHIFKNGKLNKNFIYNLRFYLYKIFFPSKIFQLCEEFRCKEKYLDTKIMYIFDNNIEELPKDLTRYSFSCFYVKSIGFPKIDSIYLYMLMINYMILSFLIM